MAGNSNHRITAFARLLCAAPDYPSLISTLSQELREQAQELRARCVAFDAGTSWESKSIATSIYKLVHDGPRQTKSLLGLLGLKTQVDYLSTARAFEPPRRVQTGPNTFKVTVEKRMPPLVRLNMREGDWSWEAPLDSAKVRHDLSFYKWWDEVIFTDSGGRDLTRKNIVHSMRSQDGGAHVDEHLGDEAYYWLKTDADPGLRSIAVQAPSLVGPPRPARAIPNGHRATIRQIGWELDETLKRLGF